MSGDDKTKQTPASQPERGNDPDYGRHDGDHTEHLTRAQIDEEIAVMEQHSRRQTQSLEPPPELPPAPPRRALVIVGLVLLGLLIAGAATLIGRRSQERALAKETERSTIPTVAIVHPQAETPDEELVLPGSLLAFAESPIYARTSGYLVRWYKDIGTRVNGGDLLATIDAPEVDQELNQTRAARQQIVAQLELAKSSAERWENLRKSDSVSAQEADQQTSAYKQAQANLAAADANVRRLEQLENFKKVYAPFSGVITKRNVDPGALINAGAGASGRELFDIARIDPLRVYTSVPQAYAPFIKVGGQTTVTLQEFPGQKFLGKIARTAESIDPNTRTLLTEVDVSNKDGRLLPGSFGEVHFAVGSNVNKVTVPVNAMLFRAEGPRLAVVDGSHKIQLRPINIGRDYGTSLEILGGVSTEDSIVINPPDSLQEGQEVQRCFRATWPARTAARCARERRCSATAAGRAAKRKSAMKPGVVWFTLSLLVVAPACTVGPRYSRPAAPAAAPDAWKTQPPWQQAAPKDTIPKGAWWQIFGDDTLNQYEEQLLHANQSLAAARDRLDQARSLARIATAAYFPQISTDPNAVRQRGSGNRPVNGASSAVIQPRPYTQNVYNIPFSLNYEVDLFGRVRKNVEAANASLQSTAADLGNVQLVLSAELAADYFTLRELDAEYQVVEQSVEYQRKALDLVQRRHEGGVASGLEVAQEATLLDSTVSQASLVQQSRAQYEHAIAVLVGQPASSFNVPVAPLKAIPPPVPLGVPSDVLERRPDIASLEREIAYENAQVGLCADRILSACHSEWSGRTSEYRDYFPV